MTQSPDGRFLLVEDLGLDEVLVYRFDASKGTLTPNNPPFAKLAPGTGPRHLAFSGDARFAYVLGEMLYNVTAFHYDAARGSLEQFQTVPMLPAPVKGNSGAEIAVHPNGKFLYASNRGADSIAVFGVDPVKGTLTVLDHVSTKGKTPRSFAIDPTGNYLFAAHQDSDNIVVVPNRPGHGNPESHRRGAGSRRSGLRDFRRGALMAQPWLQNFDPLGNTLLSTLAAAVPVCTLFFFLAVRRTPAWRAAVYAFLAAVARGAGHLSHAARHGGRRGGRWAGVRLVPHRLDCSGRGLRVRPLGGVGTVRNRQALDG